jgi:SAM-dependent methyltransferase
MDLIWTVDGDDTSWAFWADNMALAPASPLMHELIGADRSPHPGWALDLGCGTGRAFLPLTQAGYRVVGVDPTPRGIQLGQQRALQDHLDAFPVLASAAYLPIRDASISFVFAVGILFHLGPGEISYSLRETHRVLCPGGKAILHFLDVADWRRSLGREIPPEQAPVPSYRAVVTAFCSRPVIQNWISDAGLRLESMELRTTKSEAGEQYNWLAQCRR